ncbi:major facilitator superfamily domain-containing protein 6-like [Eptesicus fuscus]|uniref:major facilitator superfamily domain-containing protein 6-like n=1 Tax=Eptesicus fuscus TaxID=29078 RepID=UPI0024044AF9|nr:major facilitator superfamily domain-containing protein 6-like [Eptesicus fuscus]
MSANPQWDIRRALGVAGLFHLVCGARDASVTPFLTLYLRQLGLAAPWVGILMGSKHLTAAFWAPFCAFLAHSHRRRRVLLAGSLLGSVGASLLVLLVPPLDGDLGHRSCHAGHGATPAVPPAEAAPAVNFTPAQEPGSSLPARRGAGVSRASGFSKGPAAGVQAPSSHLPGNSVGPVEGAWTTSEVLHPVPSGREATPWEGAFKGVSSALPLLAGGPALRSPANVSATQGNSGTLGLSVEGWRRTFIPGLVSLVFWELLAAPLEQVADDSLFEYLDFVDATDRHRNLWVWKLLGTAAGVCGIAAAVEQLGCSLKTGGPRGAVSFYGYALLSTLALPVSTVFPVPIGRRREPRCKTSKALSLVEGDPRLVLLAVTVFLTGAVTSTVQNFLFWHMQDQGSSELVMGFSVALGLLGEILLHPFRTTVLRKLSRPGTIGLGLGCLAGQLLYYSFLWSWWSVLPVQALSALSSGALWWAVGASIEDLATPGTERPLSAMFRGHFYGAGASLGSFVGGFVVWRFSLPVLYQASCAVLGLWLALFLSVQPRLPQEQKISYSKLLVVEASDTSDSEQGTERDWLVKASVGRSQRTGQSSAC